ncbi:hypothetical protein DRF59_19820 [Chryseobacterium flavum]|uniref:Carboxypeptidase regulatory-like domain-containing protein n=1 Tax=Chryseobacterium flavum TaxID=415851 RepID=A0A3D9CFY2_9FLAO|nr:prealbumin-like fold domain-containing protein [Chryseobacterium flavum]REC64653.1 hypothetical protein DRF59_19820 [Chryseobacterium flavum]
MNKHVKSFVFSIIFLVPYLSVRAQKTPEFIPPAVAFNKEEAYKMLDEGNNSIRGNISLKKRGYVNYPGFSDMVLLYPATPYFQEYIELKKKYNSKKKQAGLTREAAMARIETKTIDDKGNFQFTNIKPGKYYIVSWIKWEKVTRNEVQSGPVTANRNMLGIQMGGGYFPTKTQYESQAYENEVGAYIEVSANNPVTTVTIAQ